MIDFVSTYFRTRHTTAEDTSVSHHIANTNVSGSSSLDKLVLECRKYVKCDTARISKPGNRMFLIIGFNRHTKDDEGIWINQNNKRIDFDYVQETVVASGNNKKELIISTKEYQRLCGITWDQYFDELRQTNCR